MQLVTDKMFELYVLSLSCVLAVTGVLTGYVCELFVESICNVFRFCDFLFTNPDEHGVLVTSRRHILRRCARSCRGFLINDHTLVERYFCCLDHIGHLVSPCDLCLSLSCMATTMSLVSQSGCCLRLTFLCFTCACVSPTPTKHDIHESIASSTSV